MIVLTMIGMMTVFQMLTKPILVFTMEATIRELTHGILIPMVMDGVMDL